MLKIFKDLAFAMINATLILILLCLFLVWRINVTANALTETFAQNVQVLAPVQADVKNMTAELVALRSDIEAIRLQSGAFESSLALRVDAQLDGLESRMTALSASMSPLLENPSDLIDKGIESAIGHAASAIADLRGCVAQPKSAALTVPALSETG